MKRTKLKFAALGLAVAAIYGGIAVAYVESAHTLNQDTLAALRLAAIRQTDGGRWPVPFHTAAQMRHYTVLAASPPWWRYIWPKRQVPGITVTRRINTYSPA